MYTYHKVELLARDHQRQRLQEAEDYRLIRQVARRQHSRAALKHLALGLIAFLIKLGAMAVLLSLTTLLTVEV